MSKKKRYRRMDEEINKCFTTTASIILGAATVSALIDQVSIRWFRNFQEKVANI